MNRVNGEIEVLEERSQSSDGGYRISEDESAGMRMVEHESVEVKILHIVSSKTSIVLIRYLPFQAQHILLCPLSNQLPFAILG